MADPILVNVCPTCRAVEALSSVIQRSIDDPEVLRLLADLMAGTDFVLGGTVLRYVELFTPPKHALSWARVRKVIQALVPVIQSGQVMRGERRLQVTVPMWQEAFASVFAAAEKGSLKLPLGGDGYLMAAVTNIAEAAAEKAASAPAPRRDTVQVRGQTMSIGDGLAQLYGDRDPALDKIERDSQRATPVPESVQAFKARLKGKSEGTA